MANQFGNTTPRKDAELRGDKTYIGTVPCKHCGSFEKTTSSCRCWPCHRAAGLAKLNNPNLMSKYRTKSHQKRKNDRRRRNGLHWKDYEALLSAQLDCCKICGRHKDFFTRKLSVDHCHASGKVRGLLCGPCNTGLGQFQDNTDRMQRAILYLEENK